MDYNEKINIQKALDELEISLDNIELTKIDHEYIKKKYHKLALKWHPDKNSDLYAKEKFQKISEAYDYLTNELYVLNDETNATANATAYDFVSYKDILGHFISSL